MPISLKNSSGRDLTLIYPNGSQIVFRNGQTTSGAATGTYSIKDGNTSITSIDYRRGTLSAVISSATIEAESESASPEN